MAQTEYLSEQASDAAKRLPLERGAAHLSGRPHPHKLQGRLQSRLGEDRSQVRFLHTQRHQGGRISTPSSAYRTPSLSPSRAEGSRAGSILSPIDGQSTKSFLRRDLVQVRSSSASQSQPFWIGSIDPFDNFPIKLDRSGYELVEYCKLTIFLISLIYLLLLRRARVNY